MQSKYDARNPAALRQLVGAGTKLRPFPKDVLAAAFKAGNDEVLPVKPTGIAKSLAIGSPADGHAAARLAAETGGAIEDVSDDEIVDAIRLLASTEGLFAETAGGVTIGVLRKLAEAGVVRPHETVVAYVTGNGFKTIEALEGRIGPWATVPASLDAFLAATSRSGVAEVETKEA